MPGRTDAYSDPRLAEAGERAEVLYRRAWDYAGHQETDGFVPQSMLARLCPVGWKARAKALVDNGLWIPVDGGFRPTDWDDVMGDMRSLSRRREADNERQKRKRDRDREAARDALTSTNRDENSDESRPVSRDNPHAEETREERTPQPPAQRGDCDPISQPHTNCRGCGTSRRALARAAAEAALAADLERKDAAKNAPHCGHPDCHPETRWRTPEVGGTFRCPECHEVSILARLQAPQLAVVGAR